MSSFLRPRPRACLFARRIRKGFTLVELLVVVAIIGVLAGILIPVIGSVRTSAKQALAVSHMRQMGTALLGYATDHAGAFPNTSHDPEAESWIFVLSPYLGDVHEIRVCPLDPHHDARLANQLSSYLINDWLDSSTYYDGFGRLTGIPPNLRTLPHASRTHTIFVGQDNLPLGISNDHTHAREWANDWRTVYNSIAPDRFRSGTQKADRTNGRSPYLFADGHIDVIAATEFKRRIESGENPARPPL